MSSRSKVYFNFNKTGFSLRSRNLLKKRIERIFKDEGKALKQLNYIFTSDKEVLQINLEYLKHDYFTDIITFDLSDSKKSIIGEVYISIDRVRDNAKLFHVLFEQELKRVIFHGALHLCGYKDKSARQKEKMRQREAYYLDKF